MSNMSRERAGSENYGTPKRRKRGLSWMIGRGGSNPPDTPPMDRNPMTGLPDPGTPEWEGIIAAQRNRRHNNNPLDPTATQQSDMSSDLQGQISATTPTRTGGGGGIPGGGSPGGGSSGGGYGGGTRSYSRPRGRVTVGDIPEGE